LRVTTPESWVGEAVLSGFDVTRESIFESRIRGNRENQVVPAIELIQRQLVLKPLLGPKNPRR